MNNDQLEELEAISYIFTSEEMQRDDSVFEFIIKECQNLRIQIIWPQDYPCCALIVALNDNRIKRGLKLQVEKDCNEYAEGLTGSAATFAVVDFVKENLEKWRIEEKMGDGDGDEEEDELFERDLEEKKVQMTKAQKKKMYKFVDGNGERPRGWNWVDLVSHVRCI